MYKHGTKRHLFLLSNHLDQHELSEANYYYVLAKLSKARGRGANLTGDLATVEDGLGGEIGVVGWQGVHVD